MFCSWKKEIDRPFYAGVPAVLSTAFSALLTIVFLWGTFAYSSDGAMTVGILFFAPAAVWGAYWITVWRASISRGRNRAQFEQKSVFLARSNFRDPTVWSLGYIFFGVYAVALIVIYVYFLDDEPSSRAQVVGHPVTVTLFLLFFLVYLPISYIQTPGVLISLRMGPDGLELFYGGRSALHFKWDAIKAIHLESIGMQMNMQIESDVRQPVKKGVFGGRIEGLTQFDVKGFDTEPNAILRVVRECIRNPDAREVLGTREGVDFVTFGPSWKQAQKMKVGETWSGDGI